MTRTRMLVAATIGALATLTAFAGSADAQYWRDRPYRYYDRPTYYYPPPPPPPPVYYRPYVAPRVYYPPPPPPRPGFSFYFGG